MDSATGIPPSGGDGAAANSDAKVLQMGIIASATDAIITVDEQQRITLFNAAAERMFRHPAAEAIGASLDRFIPVRFREIHREHIRAFGATGISARSMGVQRSLTALRSDGVEFPVEATISQVTINGERLFTAIVRDVTDRRRAEEALQETAGRLRAIFETAVDGIITIDAHGLITAINPAATRTFGYEAEEVLGQNVKILMPQPYRAEHDQYIHNYHATGERQIIGIGREVVGLRKDGSTFPMDLAVSETNLGSRRIYTGIIRDVSERKQAEEALLDREARLHAVVQTAADAILVLDATGVIESTNTAASELFGYSETELLALNVQQLFAADPHSRRDVWDSAAGLSRRVPAGVRQQEIVCVRKNGSMFPVILAVSPFQVRGAKMFTAILHDISHRRELEREVLDAAAAEQRRIAADLHDGLCQHLLATSLSAEVVARRLAKTASTEAEAVSNIGQMLRESIAQARALSHGLNPIDARPGGLFASLQDLADRIAAQCGITCVLECDTQPPDVDAGTALHLYRIAQEAISNAIRHGKAQRITMRLSAARGQVVLSIVDNGIGVTVTSGGRGMGLHTMAHRARVLGGRLDFQAAVGGGTEVVCAIPVAGLKVVDRSFPPSTPS